MVYKPIESYGVIGDLHTVALVGMDGSIDWCCLPHFDSPSIFAAILDEQRGGFFKIASLHEAQHKQMYLPDSNVLVTRFLSPDGVGEVIDFMPVQDPSRGKKTHQIVRVVRAVRGAVRFRLECQPAFDGCPHTDEAHWEPGDGLPRRAANLSHETGRGAGDGLTGSEGTFNMCTLECRLGKTAERPYRNYFAAVLDCNSCAEYLTTPEFGHTCPNLSEN